VTARPSVFALSVNSNRVALTDAAAVQTSVINVSAGTEVANLNLTIDTPSELDREAVTEPGSGADATASLSHGVRGRQQGNRQAHESTHSCTTHQILAFPFETEPNGSEIGKVKTLGRNRRIPVVYAPP